MTIYCYDTEFLDDGNTIELISIGIVCEDGREYYAVNADCNFGRVFGERLALAQRGAVAADIEKELGRPAIRARGHLDQLHARQCQAEVGDRERGS